MLNRGLLVSAVLCVRRIIRAFASEMQRTPPCIDPFDLAWCSDIGRLTRERV